MLKYSLERRQKAMTENQKAKITQLRKAGYGYGKIAKTLDISLNTVKSFCRRKNIGTNASTISPVTLTGEITCSENCGSEILQIAKRKKKKAFAVTSAETLGGTAILIL